MWIGMRGGRDSVVNIYEIGYYGRSLDSGGGEVGREKGRVRERWGWGEGGARS